LTLYPFLIFIYGSPQLRCSFLVPYLV